MPNEADAGVLRRFVEGDPDAFESLFRQFDIEVYRWILGIVCDPSTAEDVVLVEAFSRAYRARAQFDPLELHPEEVIQPTGLSLQYP